MKKILLVIIILAFVFIVDSKKEIFSGNTYNIPEGVYIKLTKDFYDSLKSSGNITYSNDPSIEYLRQIAVSTKFMVETNLQILKQQEKIIQLLEKR